MTSTQKVALVRGTQEEFDLAPALRALSLARSTYHYHVSEKRSYETKYAPLRTELLAIARTHPEYGYRRAASELSERCQRAINRKVVQRLHRCWDLPLLRQVKAPKPGGIRRVILAAGDRVNLVRPLEVIGPFDVAYTDFTEIAYGSGIAVMIPMLDHETKVVLGWAVDRHKTAAVALRAWSRAVTTLRGLGRRPADMIMHHDQGSAFISYEWAQRLVLKDGCRLSFSLNGAKDNTEMESFFSRFKTENASLFLDAMTLDELVAVVARRIRYYNWDRRHSTLGNQAPMRYAKSLKERR
jgi:putative transposase